jgi:hypothetical protein
MRHFRTETVPEHTKQVETHRTCDSCGQVIPEPDGPGNRYGHDEIRIKISRTLGETYPDGANLDNWDFDCCPDCWESKVLPIFALKGDKPTDVGW